MTNKIRKRLINVMDAGGVLFKQTIFNELEIHRNHMDEYDYLEFMHLYIAKLEDELTRAKLAMEIWRIKQ